MSPRSRSGSSFCPLTDLVDPAVRVWQALVLAGEQLLTQPQRDGTRLTAADDPLARVVVHRLVSVHGLRYFGSAQRIRTVGATCICTAPTRHTGSPPPKCVSSAASRPTSATAATQPHCCVPGRDRGQQGQGRRSEQRPAHQAPLPRGMKLHDHALPRQPLVAAGRPSASLADRSDCRFRRRCHASSTRQWGLGVLRRPVYRSCPVGRISNSLTATCRGRVTM